MSRLLPRTTASLAAVGALVLTCVAAPSPALAQNGPGIGNVPYPTGEHLAPIARIDASTGVPSGHGFVTIHRGYLLVIFSNDGGGGNGSGGFAFLDVSDPRHPRPVFTTHGNAAYGRGTPNDARDIREAHGFSISGDVLCLPTNLGRGTGLQFWDIANPRAPRKLSFIDLPGLTGGDYAPTPWWVFWQGHHVYVAGTSAGLFIVDATDPANPAMVSRGGGRPNPIPTSALGMARVNVCHAVGNLLVLSNADDEGIATLDISDPENPVLLDALREKVGYSMTVNGDRVLGARDPARIFDISDPRSIRIIADGPNVAGKGGYGAFQDGVFHYGSSSDYVKLDISSTPFRSLGTARPSGFPNADWDFATPLGNLVYAGNDHGGSALVVHDVAPDTTGPAVNMVIPRDGATGQALTSRIGLTFTDLIDLGSVDPSTLIVRRRGSAMQLAGRFAHQNGTVTFSPDQPLLPNAVYEVVVPAGGLTDFAGNPTATDFTSVFATGSAITTPMTAAGRGEPPAPTGATVTFRVVDILGATSQPEVRWHFGDGTVSPFSGAGTATHTYATPGHHRVVMEVQTAGGQWTQAAFTQTIHRPLAPDAPTASSTIAHDPTRGRIWTVNADNDTVTAIDASPTRSLPSGLALARLFEVPVGERPRTIARAPDGTFWVACQDAAEIAVLHPDDGRRVATISLRAGSAPFGIAFAPDGSAAWLTLEAEGRLLELDPATRAVRGGVDVGPTPRGVAVTPDARRVLVARFISAQDRGAVHVVDAATRALGQTVDLAIDPGPDAEDAGRGVPNYLGMPSVSPDGATAWVPSKKDNVERGAARDGLALTFESSVRAIASAIDLATLTEDPATRIDFNDRELPRAVAWSGHGDWAFVALQGSNAVEVRDAYDGSLAVAIERTGKAPQGVLLAGDVLFVHHFTGRTVHAYDVGDITAGTGTTFTDLGEVATVGHERLAPDVLLGKQIFYDASDRRMNLDGYLSCASCHLDGGQDGRVWDFTDRGEGFRNTIDLRGRRGDGHGPVHWSANFDEIQDFEHDIRGAFGGAGFLSDAELARGTRSDPLGTPKAGGSAELDALAAFVASLHRVPDSPHRDPAGGLTPDALAGRGHFARLGCASCHGGADFTDSATGLRHDVGTLATTSGQRLGGTLDGLDTPTLRGVWASAPYLHDGSAATLADVIDRSGPAHGDAASLSAQEKRELEAYLLQLDGREPAAPLGPPSVRIASPQGGQTLIGSTVDVAYRKGGDLSGIAHARLRIDGGGWRDDVDFDGLHAIPGVDVGRHTVEIELVDAAGASVPGVRVRHAVDFLVTVDLRVIDPRSRPHRWAPWSKSHATDTLEVGRAVYDDRSYTFTDVGPYAGLTFVRTSNDDKSRSHDPFLRFTVNHPVTVYVAFDERARSTPSWMRGWRDTGNLIQTTDGARRVFARDVPSGTILLGGNRAAGADSMYTPFVEARRASLTVGAPLVWSRKTYQIATVGVGERIYIDRRYELTSVGPFDGMTYIRTANADKRWRGNAFLAFPVNQPVTVYVAFDARATALPAWLQSWRATGLRIETTDGPRDVYAKDWGGGIISIGGNAAPGADSNYTVIVERQGHGP